MNKKTDKQIKEFIQDLYTYYNDKDGEGVKVIINTDERTPFIYRAPKI